MEKCVYWVSKKVIRGAQSDVHQRRRMHGTSWLPNGTYASSFWDLSFKFLFNVSSQLEKSVQTLCEYAILCTALCHRTSLSTPLHHTTQSTRQKPHQDTRGRWAHNGVVHRCAFLKNKHYDTEHCGTQSLCLQRTYFSDEHILKTISNEHLLHFVALLLLDSIVELMPHSVLHFWQKLSFETCKPP